MTCSSPRAINWIVNSAPDISRIVQGENLGGVRHQRDGLEQARVIKRQLDVTLCGGHGLQMILLDCHIVHLFNDTCVRGYPHVRTLNRVESSGLWISLDIKEICNHPNATLNVKTLINDTPILKQVQIIERTNGTIPPNVHIPALK